MLPLFASHPRNWRENRYVYPVISRRCAGLSIGINLNPDKACNFDCPYCSVDRRDARAGEKSGRVDLNVLRLELEGMLDLAVRGELFRTGPFDQTPGELRRINDVAFSGDGEPTAYPRFEEACGVVVKLLAGRRLEGVKPVVITNATLLHRAGVRRGMDLLHAAGGEIWAKLDAGTEEYYRRVDRTSVPFKRVLENLLAAGRRWGIVVQSIFVKLEGEEPVSAEIEEYIARLRELAAGGCRIERVQVYTLARKPAEEWVGGVSDELLGGIAGKVRGVGLDVGVFAGR